MRCFVGVPAAAGVEDWEVNELLVLEAGDPAIQYIELRNEVGGCLFPSSRVEVLDSSGSLVDAFGTTHGQVCFSSSATRYDCVRYGTLATPVPDFFGVGDTSATLAPPDGISLARIDRTHVVIDDWQLATPTPGDFNDGAISMTGRQGPGSVAGTGCRLRLQAWLKVRVPVA